MLTLYLMIGSLILGWISSGVVNGDKKIHRLGVDRHRRTLPNLALPNRVVLWKL